MARQTLSQNANTASRNTFRAVLQSFIAISGLGILFNGWASTSELMGRGLNAPTHKIDEWTRRWQEQKTTELQFVSVTVRILADKICIAVHVH